MQKLHIANSSKKVNFYSLDAIISVGYRVNSYKATQFRIWATWVAEIKLRAARRIGEISKGLEKGSGGDRKSDNFKGPIDMTFEKTKKQALAEAGLSKQVAHRFEKIAAISEEEFEYVIAKSKEKNKPITITEIER